MIGTITGYIWGIGNAPTRRFTASFLTVHAML